MIIRPAAVGVAPVVTSSMPPVVVSVKLGTVEITRLPSGSCSNREIGFAVVSVTVSADFTVSVALSMIATFAFPRGMKFSSSSAHAT